MKNRYLYIVPVLIMILTGCGKKELVCLNGYVLNEKDETCERTVEVDAKEVYHCEGRNVTIDGDQCRVVDLTPASAEKKCNIGYTLNDGMCVKDDTVYNFSKCDTESTYSKSLNECFQKLEPITTYSCEFGQLEGSNCANITYVKADIEFVCEDANYKLNGNKCVYTIITPAKDSKSDY